MCKNIIERNKNIGYIETYLVHHNNKFPSDCFVNAFFRHLFNIPDPYRFDFTLTNHENSDAVINEVLDRFIFTIYCSRCAAHCFISPPINRKEDKPERPKLSSSYSSESSQLKHSKKRNNPSYISSSRVNKSSVINSSTINEKVV